MNIEELIEKLPMWVEKEQGMAWLTINYDDFYEWFAGYVLKQRDGKEQRWGFTGVNLKGVLSELYDKYGTGK